MPKNSDLNSTSRGAAALSVCESMLIALGDLKVFTHKDSLDILKDAANAHRNAGGTAEQAARHEIIALIIERVRTSGNSVRR